MKRALQLVFLLFLAAFAARMALEAYESLALAPVEFPQGLYESIAADPERSGYLLGSVNGRAAILRNDASRECLYESRIPLALLRNTDRMMLERGIPLPDLGSARRLLEDFGP